MYSRIIFFKINTTNKYNILYFNQVNLNKYN